MLKPHRSAALLLVSLVLISCACSAFGAEKTAKPTASAKAVSKSDAGADAVFAAAVNPAAAEEKQEKEPPVYLTALSFIGKLALVLGLAYGTILVLKRFSGMRAVTGGSQNRIRVLENSSLGASKSLHLVEVGNRKLLVGATPSQVNLITELETTDFPEPDPNTPSAGFKDQLSLFLGINKTDASPAARNVAQMLAESSSFLTDRASTLSRRKSAESG